MLYERTALSKQPDELVKQELAALRDRGDMTPAMLLKDPYILDFLGLTTGSWSAIWKMPFCVSWRHFF